MLRGNANQMQDEKVQAVVVFSFAACSVFLWFDVLSDWSSHIIVKMSKSNQSVHRFSDSHSKMKH